MALVKLSAGEQRRLSAFITCLFLAAFAWVITALANPYDFTVKRVLVYRNPPLKRAFHSLQSDTVSVTVRGSGWQMLFAKINRKMPVNVDLQPLTTSNYVVLSTQLNQINGSDTSQRVISFNPDTLFFDFSNRMVKRVPVRLLTSIKYQRQFAQSSNAVVHPAFVTLDGPSSRISKITEWDTDSLLAGDVNATIHTRLNLKQVNEGNMSVYPKSVAVVLPVDEFTEKTLQIPVKLINNSEFYNVHLFPQKVTITFVTALKKYAETDENFFEAQADLDLWNLKGYTTLPVILARMPPYCRIISIDPPNIDFIIRK
jgi:YbbR domain-containing protein